MKTARRPDRERRERAWIERRSAGLCEVVIEGARCRRRKMRGIHHLVKRAQGGTRLSWETHKMALCPLHHDLADNASVSQRTFLGGTWYHGRLFIRPGTFEGRLYYAATVLDIAPTLAAANGWALPDRSTINTGSLSR